MPFLFNSSSDRLLATANIPNYNSVYTVMCWVYLTASPSNGVYYTITSINDNTSSNMDWFGIYGAGGSDYLNVANNVSEVGGSTALSTSTWYHVAFVRASATAQYAYLNGVLEATNSDNPGASRTTPTRFEFGAFRTSNLQAASIRLAGIKVWDTNLSVAEIQQEMWTLRPQRYANLNRFCPVFSGSGEGERDYSGNGYNFTATGLTDTDPPPVSYGAPIIYIDNPTAGGGTEYTLEADGSITSAGLIVHQVGLPRTGAITSSGGLIKTVAGSQVGTIVPAGALVKQPQLTPDGAITSDGVLTNLRMRLLDAAGALTPAGTLVKQVGKQAAGALTPAGTLVRGVAAALAGALTPTGATIKGVGVSQAGGLTPTGALAVLKVALLDVAGSIASSGALALSVGKQMAGTLASAGTLVKQVQLGLAGALTSAGGIVQGVATSLSGAIASAGELATVHTPGGGAVAVVRAALTFSRRLVTALTGSHRAVTRLTGSDRPVTDLTGSDREA